MKNRNYISVNDFFHTNGRTTMKLDVGVAHEVCIQAAGRGFYILCIEGGIFSGSAFEARIDCIWDSKVEPKNLSEAEENNRIAAEFIEEESLVHNAFIITTERVG